MTALVSLDEVKKALVIDYDDDDERLSIFINGASGAIVNYLKSGANIFKDDEGNIVAEKIPPEVKSATIALTGIMLREPDGDSANNFAELGTLPFVVTTLIYQLRDPALA